MRYRLAILSRMLAAAFGGYALAATCAAALAVWLPMRRADAVVAALLLALVVQTLATLWAFAAASATRAWCCLVLLSLALAPLAFGGNP